MRMRLLAVVVLAAALAPGARVLAARIVVGQPVTGCADPEDKFGLALDALGPNLLVGAPGEVCGFAHLLDGRTGAELLTVRSPVDDEANGFGTAVADAGRHFLVSAPAEDAVYLFHGRTGEHLVTYANPGCCFGGFGAAVVALDRWRIAVGTPFAGDGVVHVFELETGALLDTISNPTPGIGRRFGTSLAAARGALLVGAPIDPFPPSTSAGGAFVIDPDTGAVRAVLEAPAPTPGDRFGAAVAALSGRLLVGAPGVAAAHLFTRSGRFVRSFAHPTGQAASSFGAAVALRGGRVLVGAPFSDAGDVEGAAFLFRARSGALEDEVLGQDFDDGLGRAVTFLRGGFAAGAPTQNSGYVVLVR